MTSTDLPRPTTRVACPPAPARRWSGVAADALADLAAVSPGVVPFGLMLGVTAVVTGTGGGAAILGAATVYGGSAQLTAITLLHLGSGALAALASGVVVNARLLLYGAAMEARFRDQPRWFRLLGPFALQDQTFLSASARPAYDGAQFRRYWGWLTLALLVVWTSSVAAGVLLAPVLPPLPHLALVGTALFVSMLVPRLVDRTALVTAGAAAAGALVLGSLVPELGIVGGALVGAVAGTVAARRWGAS